MAVRYDKFGVKEVMNATFYDLESNRPVLYVDTLKMSNLENTAEESHARGGYGNPILLTWDYNREATFTIQDALIGFDGLALMTGNPVTTDAEIMYQRETITIPTDDHENTSSELTLKHTPTTDSLVIYDNYSGIAGGVILHALSGNVATINATNVHLQLPAERKEVVVYYAYSNTDTSKQVVTITSDNFPGYYRIVGDTFIRSANTGNDELFQLIVERAKVQPGFSLTIN